MSGVAGMVAVDVGNSVVKLAARRDQTVIDHAIRIRSTRWEQSAVSWVHEHVSGNGAHWRIASVHRAAAARLTAAVAESDAKATIQFVTRHDVPLELDVDHPDRLGIDRLLSAFAAILHQDPPAVIIDAGSAVTVDWVCAQRRFRGGAILPGLDLQSRALATGTEALPEIQWGSDHPIRLPAKNTEEAIRSGILAGMSASIDALIERYREAGGIQGSEVRVILTGGDGPAISPHLRHIHQVMPNLVCRGLLDLPRSGVGSTGRNQEPG